MRIARKKSVDPGKNILWFENPTKRVVAILRPLPCFMLEDITTEPHAHDISADIMRVWLSGYILQQYTYMRALVNANEL